MPDGLKICAVSRVEFDTAIEWTTNEGWNPGLDGDGLKTWQVSMAQLGERVISLDGVIDQQANYWKLGSSSPTAMCAIVATSLANRQPIRNYAASTGR